MALADISLVGKSDNVLHFVEFDDPASAHYVGGLAFRPLAKHGRLASGDRPFEPLLVVEQLDFVSEDTDGALLDRDVAAVYALAGVEVHHHLVGLDHHLLISI